MRGAVVRLDLSGARLLLHATKTERDRRVALDPASIQILTDQRTRYESRAGALGLNPSDDAYVFSKDPDHGASIAPASVSQRYKRMCLRLGIDSHLHNLRHYSATELIAAGVDVRTVAGRLGHSDGTTTLKVYAAWLAEADQRASQSLFSRLPAPRELHPHECVPAALRDAILDGLYGEGTQLPTIKQIAAAHDVSVGTAHRALEHLTDWGFVEVRRGVRPTISARDRWPTTEKTHVAAQPAVCLSHQRRGNPRASTGSFTSSGCAIAKTCCGRSALKPTADCELDVYSRRDRQLLSPRSLISPHE